MTNLYVWEEGRVQGKMPPGRGTEAARPSVVQLVGAAV